MTGIAVAIKQIGLEMQGHLVINEILVMPFSHPNIITFINTTTICGSMEYIESGSLTELLATKMIAKGQIAAVSRETMQGLEYLHQHGAIHRDVKTQNVLLNMVSLVSRSPFVRRINTRGPDYLYVRCRIADFGFCAKLSNPALG